MEKQVRIPKFFHELFGSSQQTSEMLLTLGFTITATLAAAWFTAPYWMGLEWYQSLVLWVLFLDISGGVVANLSRGTNDHYNGQPMGRWVFIAVHVQPLILAVVLKSSLSVALAVWAYTIMSSSLVNILRKKVYHRLLAGALYAVALCVYTLWDITLPPIVSLIYLLYMMKVIYSFSVDHAGGGSHE